MKEKTALLLNARLPKLKVLPDSTYETCIKYLGNHFLELACRTIGGRPFIIVYPDREGEENETRSPAVTAYSSNNEPVFYGNLIICKHDKKGDDIPLTEEDIRHIQKNTKNVVGKYGQHPVLINVDRTSNAAELPDADEITSA